MASRTVGAVLLECFEGDITRQPGFDAIVNAANAELKPGGGVAGAIHRAAGPGLEAECRPLAPIAPGQAVITGGHKLPNPHVIHCLGPVYGGDVPSDRLLANCYRQALELAESRGLGSVCFPAISTGVFAYPMEEAARVALQAIGETLPRLRHVKRIAFALHGERALRVHEAALAAVLP